MVTLVHLLIVFTGFLIYRLFLPKTKRKFYQKVLINGARMSLIKFSTETGPNHPFISFTQNRSDIKLKIKVKIKIIQLYFFPSD